MSEDLQCVDCGESFDPKFMAMNFPQYYEFPYNYGAGDHEYCLACWLDVGPQSDLVIETDDDVVTYESEAGDLQSKCFEPLDSPSKVRADLALLDEALQKHAELFSELGRERARIRDEALERVDEVWGSMKAILPPVTGHLHFQGRVLQLRRTRRLLEEHVEAALHDFRKKEYLAWWELFGEVDFEVLSCTPEEGFDDYRLHDGLRERYDD